MGDRGGWVKFRREWLNDPAINGDADRLAVFMYLLCNAAIAPTPAMFGGKAIILQPGQLTAGRNQIATKTGVEPHKVWRATECLKSAHLIEQRASNKNSLFSVLCGDFSSGREQQNEQQMSSKVSTFEESRKLRNISSSDLPDGSTDKPKVKKVFEHDANPYKAARWLADQIEARMPTCKAYSENQLQAWALDFDRCNRLDGHPWTEINDVLSFSQSDSFWQQNILSGGKFRKQYITLLAKMNGGKP